MAIYLLNFLSIPIYGHLIKDRKRLVRIISIQLFLILALRAQTLGHDLSEYVKYYEYYQVYTLGEILAASRFFLNTQIPWGLESGYVLFSWIIGELGFSFHSFLVIHAAICIAGFAVFIYRYSHDVPMSYMLFLALGGYGFFFGILRQTLGFVILLFAVPALKQRKFLKYFALVLAAVLFHRICLLALPLYFLTHFKLTRVRCVAVAAVSVLAVFLTPIVLQHVLTPILALVGKEGVYTLQAFQWNNMFLLMLLMFLASVFFLGARSRSVLDDRRDLYWGFAMALPIQAVAFFVPVFSRAAIGLFLPYGYVTFANALRWVKPPKWRAILRGGAIAALFAFYVYTMRGDITVPYVWVHA